MDFIKRSALCGRIQSLPPHLSYMSLTTEAKSGRPGELVTSFFCLLSCSVLSFLISRRTPTKIYEWKHLTWGKLCMILILCDGWIFVFLTGFMLTGVGTGLNPRLCTSVMLTCILSFGAFRVLVSTFLIEKLYIVWSNELRTPRLKSPIFRISMTSLLGYGGLVAPAVWSQTTSTFEEGSCSFTVKTNGLILLSVYDLIQVGFFTFMFCWPLCRSRIRSAALRTVAKMTLVGGALGLLVSSANLALVFQMKGHQLDWVCVTSCVLDITLNGLIFYWVSSGAPSDSINHFTLPTISLTSSAATYNEARSDARGIGSSTNKNLTIPVPVPVHGNLSLSSIYSCQGDCPDDVERNSRPRTWADSHVGRRLSWDTKFPTIRRNSYL
ncbi:hypothetical protein PM082_006945 [Marasmius tenuissimus]|nr:hypothetical protein PM082_006945 [Marasmius tenuissimus]